MSLCGREALYHGLVGFPLILLLKSRQGTGGVTGYIGDLRRSLGRKPVASLGMELLLGVTFGRELKLGVTRQGTVVPSHYKAGNNGDQQMQN